MQPNSNTPFDRLAVIQQVNNLLWVRKLITPFHSVTFTSEQNSERDRQDIAIVTRKSQDTLRKGCLPFSKQAFHSASAIGLLIYK